LTWTHFVILMLLYNYHNSYHHHDHQLVFSLAVTVLLKILKHLPDPNPIINVCHCLLSTPYWHPFYH
jgi:hypothetical protein